MSASTNTISPISGEDPLATALPCEGTDPESCGCLDTNQDDYRGQIKTPKHNREFTTGVECQRWEAQVPHIHTFSPEDYPDSGMEDNACRNPDHDPHGPWCFTTDPKVEWGYCDVPVCLLLGKIDLGNLTLTNSKNINGIKVESDSWPSIITQSSADPVSSTLCVIGSPWQKYFAQLFSCHF